MTQPTIETEEKSQQPELFYPNVYDWVEEYLVYFYKRPVVPSRIAWCPQWWKHIEAVVRLEALWRAWEAMRKQDPMTGLAKWMIELCDPTMDRLLDPDGTFKGCTDKHHKTRPSSDLHLPFDKAPDVARTDLLS
ncbi:DUF4913 domain-containing protein [Trueperella pyogenes]|uniref:DUF4913 domain-containing protein n=1 Tax=Trueperella pyogenes TaxID=1661 RepID=UPI00345D6F5C